MLKVTKSGFEDFSICKGAYANNNNKKTANSVLNALLVTGFPPKMRTGKVVHSHHLCLIPAIVMSQEKQGQKD